MRQYGLFYKVGKRWVRLFPRRSYSKSTAVRVFQGHLIGLFMRGKQVELRAVKVPAVA